MAHFGVLRALAESGLRPTAISGTSAGALVGALIADGRDPQEAGELAKDAFSQARLLRRPSLVARRIHHFLKNTLRCHTFEGLQIPLYVSATNLEYGGQRIFDSGPLIPALMASCAIPVIFPPVKVEGIYHVDGGLSNNLPVEPFAAHLGKVVAVHVNPLPVFVLRKRRMLRTLDRIWHLNFREMVIRSAEGCYLFIEPPELSRFNMLELSKAAVIEQIGYEWTKTLLAGQLKKG